MIAIFFKNNKANAEKDAAIQMRGESALHDRMTRMLRQEAKLAWMPVSTHLPQSTDVKESFAGH